MNSAICGQPCWQAGKHVGAPLTLAAGATAAGFLSFLPTDYRGVSELGLIAGFGMLIAFATSVTILPALIRLLNPPGEPDELGFSSLAPVDGFLERQRIPIIVGTAIVVIAGLPLLYWLQFDFNPINLRSPQVGIDRDLSRTQPRPRHQYRMPSRCWRRRSATPTAIAGASVEVAGSFARRDAVKLHPGSPGRRSCRLFAMRQKRWLRPSIRRTLQDATDGCGKRRSAEGGCRAAYRSGRRPEWPRRHRVQAACRGADDGRQARQALRDKADGCAHPAVEDDVGRPACLAAATAGDAGNHCRPNWCATG